MTRLSRHTSGLNVPGLIILSLIMFVIGGCNGCGKKKTLNRQLTFWKNDRIPYGTWYAFEHLDELFPDAEVRVNKKSPAVYDYSNVEGKLKQGKIQGKKLTIVITPDMEPNADEIREIFYDVGQGNHYFISALSFSELFMDSLHLKAVPYEYYFGSDTSETAGIDSMWLSLIHPTAFDTSNYGYPGFRLESALRRYDTTITQVIGYDKNGRANFVRFNYEGGGSLLINLVPGAFTNFFLLHKNNKEYYDRAFSYVPGKISDVVWDDYFRNHRNGENQGKNDFSAFQWMMKQPPLAWMLWLLLLLFGLIYFFESKRKQRPIALRPRLQNASVDFVKTIGGLYYQRRDNKNLATKMTTHFLDLLRQKYNIKTSVLDANFEKRLADKSGFSADEVSDLVKQVKMVQERPQIADDVLMDYYVTLEKFKNKFTDGR